jgi:malonyl-CoA O-methyltransferase
MPATFSSDSSDHLNDRGSNGRQLDPIAVAAVLRRLSRAQTPPWLHTEVARRMADKLQLIRYQPEQVLDWWSGLGAGSAFLAQTYPKAQRMCIEPSEAWVAAVEQRGRHQPIQPWWSAFTRNRATVNVVTESSHIPQNAGLIWANMVLHAALDPVALFERWQSLLQVNGFVMFSCLGPGTLRELRALYKRLDWPTPTPGFIDMHDLGDMLVQAGFSDPVMDQEVLTLRWSSPQALLGELRTLGGNTAPQRVAGLRTPRWRAALERELQALTAPDGSIGLSFEVAYGHAFKDAPRPNLAPVVTVPLEDMRAMVRATRNQLQR